jgi:hypothetical protein
VVVIMKRFSMSWPAIALAILWLWVFSHGINAAKLQGRIFPVISKLTVESVTPTTIGGQSAVRISGTAIKFRECNYDGISWSIGSNNTQGVVRAFFEDKAVGRQLGLQRWNALIVGITPERLELTSALVHHRCDGFPVHSKFFGGIDR